MVCPRFRWDVSVWNSWEYERVLKGQTTGAKGQKTVVVQRRFILQSRKSRGNFSSFKIAKPRSWTWRVQSVDVRLGNPGRSWWTRKPFRRGSHRHPWDPSIWCIWWTWSDASAFTYLSDGKEIPIQRLDVLVSLVYSFNKASNNSGSLFLMTFFGKIWLFFFLMDPFTALNIPLFNCSEFFMGLMEQKDPPGPMNSRLI